MAFNLFDSILNQFTGQAQQKVPSFGTPQAPRTTNYVAPNVSISTTPKVSQWVRNGGFAPWYEWTVDTSQNFLNRLLTPVEQVGTSLFKNQVQGGQQLSDIAMQHSESAIDRGYNQGYIDLWQKIKSKHPQYADISDEELGRKIVAKYPQYQDIVDAGSGIMSNPISWSLASVESGLSKWIWTMFQGISNLWSAPLQESGTAGVTRFTKGALETGLWSAQLATSIMPTTLWAKALVAPTVNTLFSTDTAWKVLQPVTQWIETGIWMWQEALGFNPESSVSKDIQNIGSTAWNLALFAGAQKGWAKWYDLAKPIVTKVGQKISNIPNPVTGAKNVITREIPVGIMERDLSLTPTERASIETINWKPAGAVALEYNLPKDKQAMADTLSVKADEAYNGITKDLKNIPTRTESAPAKEMLGIMLDEMGSSPILVRTMKPYMEKLQSMMEQPDYSLAEKNAIRRDFDRIVANKIFDSKWRVSGIEDKAIANIREWLSTELQNEAMQYGIDIKWKNNILRTSIALRDWVLRRLSQENKNNKIGLQDIWVGAIFWAGDPLTTASVIFGKKVLENSAPWIAQRLYNSNKTPYATSNLKRGVTISPRDTTNGLSIAPDNVPPVRIPVKNNILSLPAPSWKPLSANVVNVKPIQLWKKTNQNDITSKSKIVRPWTATKLKTNAEVQLAKETARKEQVTAIEKELNTNLLSKYNPDKPKATRTFIETKLSQWKITREEGIEIVEKLYDNANWFDKPHYEKILEDLYSNKKIDSWDDLLNEKQVQKEVKTSRQEFLETPEGIYEEINKKANDRRFNPEKANALIAKFKEKTGIDLMKNPMQKFDEKGNVIKTIVKPNTIKNESTAKSKKLNTNASDTIPEGYIENPMTGEIIKKPSWKTGGFIKIPEIGKKSEIDANKFVKSKNPDITLTTFEWPDEINLYRLEIPKSSRKEWKGTKAMNDLIEYADKNWKRIVLTPDNYAWSSVSRLKEFYKRFWFVENTGRNKDFSTRELMYRTPKLKPEYKSIPVKNPLVEEARKYKSAEEFVMAQWEPVYHWSKNKFEQFDSKFTKTSSNRADKWVWTYFTDNKKIAQEYAKDNWYLYTTFVNKEKSKILNWDEPLKSQKDKSVIKWIVEKYLEPNKNRYPEKWLIIDIEKSLNNKEPFWIIYEYLTSVIDEKELSKILNSKWIDWIISKDYWMWWNVYTLFDANKIKTESQLKQIYEQANKSIPVKNPLVEEAKKPKSIIKK